MRVLIEGAYTVLRVANSETHFSFILCRSLSRAGNRFCACKLTGNKEKLTHKWTSIITMQGDGAA